jgi:predicted DNA-binding protein with PD1-like motif
MAELTNFARENNLTVASLTALGAFSDAALGYFDIERKEYQEIPVEEQVEVLSLVGTIVPLDDGEPQVHAHVVLGRSDGTTWGGHLLEAHVRPTLEIIVTDSPEHLQRRTDEQTGLPLISMRDR